MSKIRSAADTNMQRSKGASENPAHAYERMSREIRGSIFTLIALFELIALTSYIPTDSLNIFEGRLDYVSNLGGIVGALLGELLLGSVGITGYSIIILTGFLAFGCFQGKPVRGSLLVILGTLLSTTLAAISCHLVFKDSFPEASLLQGGLTGKSAGDFLTRYFNVTGALLIVTGGFLVTFIVTAKMSVSALVRSMLNAREEDETEEEASEGPSLIQSSAHGHSARTTQSAKKTEKPSKPKPSRKRAKKSAGQTDDDLDDGLESLEELDDPDEIDTDDTSESDENLDDNEGHSENNGDTPEVILFTENYRLPTSRLLKNHDNGAKRLSRGEIRDCSDKIVEHLLSFQITGSIDGVSVGPVLTTFEYKPSAGIKLSKIASLQDDLGVVLGTNELRIVAPIPGKTVVGIEVPRPEPEIISFKDLVTEKDFQNKNLKLPIILGKGTDGTPLFDDLATMPHLLVAGATGSGKSVFINTAILSLLYRLSPQQLRLILIDPKMLELVVFDGIPHLLTSVITRSNIATKAMKWAVEEMERRYDMMSESGSKNIESFNAKARSDRKLPYIVIIVDELADLMFSGRREEVEIAITRLAQKARAAGIHLLIATQRPSTDVITGLIKANIPSRISFKVPSAIDSRTILDTSGAETLIGRGDSLMIRPAAALKRMHCTFSSEDELNRVVKYIQDGKHYEKYYIDFGPDTDPDEEEDDDD